MALDDKIKKLQEAAIALAEGKKAPETKDTDFSDKSDSDTDNEAGNDNDTDAIADGTEDETTSKKTVKKDKMTEAKIDLGSLFDGVELTEEFKEKATTVFESAVAARVAQEVALMEDQLAQRALDESVTLKEGLVEKVDGYLDFMVEQWMKNNEIALERGIKAEIFESFIGEMKNVFVNHNINLPDEEFDLVESLQDKAEALETTLDEQVAQNIELNKTIKQFAKAAKIEEATKGMTDIDAEKFALLAEEIAFEDEVSFVRKLDVIRENYVSKKDEKKEEKVLAEDVTKDSNTPVPELNESKVATIDPAMAQYLTAIK